MPPTDVHAVILRIVATSARELIGNDTKRSVVFIWKESCGKNSLPPSHFSWWRFTYQDMSARSVPKPLQPDSSLPMPVCTELIVISREFTPLPFPCLS